MLSSSRIIKRDHRDMDKNPTTGKAHLNAIKGILRGKEKTPDNSILM